MPPIWALVHELVFESGGVYLLALWVFGIALAIVAASSEKFRTKNSKELIDRVRRRPALWWSIVAIAGALILLACTSAGLRATRVTRVKEALAISDDCAFVDRWKALGEAERETVTPPQQFDADARINQCVEKKDAAAATAYAKRCDEVASHLNGALLPEDEKHIGTAIAGPLGGHKEYVSGAEGIGFARRIASRSLVTADLRTLKELPCGPFMKGRYLEAAAVSTAAWTGLSSGFEVGEDVRAAFGIGRLPGVAGPPAEAQLSPTVQAAVAENAEQRARKLGWVNTAAAGNATENVCILAREITGKSSPSCAALEARQKQLRAKEGIAADRADKAENDALVRCFRDCNLARSGAERQADETRASACLEKCGNDAVCLSDCGSGGSADACHARCISQHPRAVPPF
ncbi:MAG: hypothetical protein KF764_00845 [Labilithrix sp.]|nr:hypothetical protein [Labilithrix sp.]